MKYDIYKGTKNEFNNSEGTMVGKGVKASNLQSVIDTYVDYPGVKQLLDGELLFCRDGSYLWAEEAM